MNQDKALPIDSKLPASGTSIFAKMTEMALKHHAVNLAQGFPDFMPPRELIDELEKAAREGFNQYAPMPGVPALREQLAMRLERDYGYQADPVNGITVTAGATQAIYTIISAFTRPGDKVLIFEPAYDSYAPSVIVNGGIPVYLRLEEPGFTIPWNQLEEVLSKQDIRLMLINNPHNPSATVLDADDVQRVCDLCRNTGTLIVWDEVYDLLVFDGISHQSALKNKELMQRSIVVYSLGKTLHNTGWKLGYVVADPVYTNEIRKLHQFTVFSVHTPSQHAVARFMMQYPEFFEGLGGFYQEKRDAFRKLVQPGMLEWLDSRGSYFMLASYGHLGKVPDMLAAERLATGCGVAAIPISAFYHDHHDPKILRFCFAKKADTLEEAAFRLNKPEVMDIFK